MEFYCIDQHTINKSSGFPLVVIKNVRKVDEETDCGINSQPG